MDRCDRCGAAAYVHVMLDTGLPLSWCAHHWVKLADAMSPYVLPEHTIDERHLLEA